MKKIYVSLVFLATLFVANTALAQTWQTLTDDNFTRANTSVGSGVNSTNVTGPGTFNSPSTGANYIDALGNVYSINSNTLIAAPAALTSGSYSTGFLLRPVTENTLTEKVTIVATVPFGAGVGGAAPTAIVRYVGGVAYGAYAFYGGGTGPVTFAIAKVGPGSGVQTVLATGAPSLGGTSGPFVITLSAIGASPTLLTATIANAATPNTIISTLTVSDSTLALQAAGQMGLSTNASNSHTPVWTQLTTAYLNAATGYTFTGPSSGSLGTPYTYTVQANGTLASTFDVTPAVSGGTGTFSPTSVTIPTNTLTATFTFTPTSTATDTLSVTNTGGDTDPTSISFAASPGPLLIGSFTAIPTSGSSIALALSAPLSQGTLTGYGYNIYRSTVPSYTPGAGTLLATVGSMPYNDTTVLQGVQYFYGISGFDSGAGAVNALPKNVPAITASPTTQLFASAIANTTSLNMVFVGDSITYGAGVTNAGTMLSPTAPYFTVTKLAKQLGLRAIYAQNKGVSGKTTYDWCAGGTLYNGAVQASNGSSAASVLNTANPTAQMVFNIMLGTNDSASAGTNNGICGSSTVSGGLTAAQYTSNLRSIVKAILTDWPAAIVVIHDSPWYSPSFQNGATYLQAGLDRLWSYRAATADMVTSLGLPKQVMLGDTFSWNYFAQHYYDEMQTETGVNGNFYVHPSGTAGGDGFIGTQSLGEMWATSIANDFFNAGIVLQCSGSRACAVLGGSALAGS